MPHSLRISVGVDCAYIMADTYTTPTIGRYKDEGRAGEVLAEIFQYYRNGKNSYVMPKE